MLLTADLVARVPPHAGESGRLAGRSDLPTDAEYSAAVAALLAGAPDPGDVWIVDSRQIAHQIFYGRRALSIDFSVKRESMENPDRHYLSFVDRFREMREHASA